MTESSLKDLTLFDKLKLYPEIILDETINKSRGTLQALLEKVKNPNKGDNLGLILEELAKVFLTSPYLKLNAERRRCETGEIDLDFTVKRFETTLFYEFSFLLIVECKNWEKKVGAPELRVFCSKMCDVRANVGIFFSKQGLTKDAKGVIRNSWVKDGIVVLSFDLEDLDRIINGSNNLYQVLHDKYLSVRTASK